MSKHTPGPWVWTGEADHQMTFAHGLIKTWGPNNEYSDWEKHVVDGCGCCGSPFGVDDTEEMIANARLIAAAPELFSELKQADAQMDMAAECIEAGRYDEALLHVRSLSRSRRAAIAKATQP